MSLLYILITLLYTGSIIVPYCMNSYACMVLFFKKEVIYMSLKKYILDLDNKIQTSSRMVLFLSIS